MARRIALLVGLLGLVAVALLLALPWLLRERPTYEPLPNASSVVIRGHVIDAQGRGSAGVHVQWMSLRNSMGLMSSYTDEGDAVSDAEGRFELSGVSAGEGYLRVSSPGIEGESGAFAARLGHAATGLRLRAVPIPESRKLRGRLRDPAGAPVAHVMVSMSQQSWRGSWRTNAMTGPDGAFELIGFHAGATGDLSVQLGKVERSLGSHAFGSSPLELVVEQPR